MTRYAALDVGGSHIACAVVAHGRVVARRIIPVADARSWRVQIPAIEAALDALGGEVTRLGIAFPALVDGRLARVVSTPRDKYDDAVNFDFTDWGARRGVEVRLETDGRLALLGECAAGAARGVADAAMLTFGTGIGSAVLSGGTLLRGHNGSAGVLAGHLSLAADGPMCICGSVGCSEAYASGWALPALAARTPGFTASALARETIGFEALFRLADAGDAVAVDVARSVVGHWSVAVLNIVHAYDPAVVVLGGGAMAVAAAILPPIRAFVAAHAWRQGDLPNIVEAKCGADAALLGVPLLWERAA